MRLGELGELTGEDPEALRHLIAMGVLVATGDYSLADVERVRLVQLLRRRGVEPEAVGAALNRHLDLFDRYLAQVYPGGDYPSISVDTAAERVGIDRDLAQRVREAGGLGGPNELLTSADVEALQAMAVAVGAGFPEVALLQLVRVYADALGRVGDAEARLFHFYVHERLRAQGLVDDRLDAATTASVEQLLELVDPAVLYFHRRALGRAVRDDLALHLAEEAGILPPDDETGRLLAAVVFIDLARFTALTEAMGDSTAADVLNRFSDLVRRSVVDHGGRIVKQIGDAFMVVFTDAASAVVCALDIRDAAVAEPQFLGTRQGVHWGPMLYREGDYYGATVNVAARIVAEAAADRVLVSHAVRTELGDVDHVELIAAGRRKLKHVTEAVEVFEARRPGEEPTDQRTLDPVCGMAIDADVPAARLQFDGRDVRFCSQHCLQRFVENPGGYR
jgi:class 3 adenylate cyclase